MLAVWSWIILNNTKMPTTLDNTTKFLKLGDLSLDDTHKLEIKLQKRFLELFRKKFISREVYELIRPISSQRRRMYGLPKTHKSGISLRPILSMCHSAQYALAKWLIQSLNPVLELYSGFCVREFLLLPLSVNSLFQVFCYTNLHYK